MYISIRFHGHDCGHFASPSMHLLDENYFL